MFFQYLKRSNKNVSLKRGIFGICLLFVTLINHPMQFQMFQKCVTGAQKIWNYSFGKEKIRETLLINLKLKT